MKRVFICSPYKGNTRLNLAYLRMCIRNSLSKGESPFAPHAMYTQALDDGIPHERQLGFNAGLVWLDCTPFIACYVDLGVSEGMQVELDRAAGLGWTIDMRRIPRFEEWLSKQPERKS